MLRDARDLYWVFWGMGFTLPQCKHLVRCFDRLRLCNKGAGDWAAILNEWAENRSLQATSTLRHQIRRMLGTPIEEHSGSVVPQLFDEDLQTAEEPRPPGRPRG